MVVNKNGPFRSWAYQIHMKILLFANTDWYLYNFRLPLATALTHAGHHVILVSPPGVYSERLKKMEFDWFPFNLSRRGVNPFVELAGILRLSQLYKRIRPDIVHHFTIKCVLYGSLAARLASINSIVNSITGLGFVFISQSMLARILRPFVKTFYRLLLQRTQTIFQNPEDMGLFIKHKLTTPANSHLIMGSGVDTKVFTQTPEPTGDITIILPGRMLWAKGVGEFVEAARSIKAQNIKARFILIGRTDPGNPDSIPEKDLLAWQSQGIIEWQGWQENMAAAYSKAHIVCLPSYREGLPKSLIEAAACGRPLVATDMPGCRQVVHPGENGFLVPVRDADALASALLTLIGNPKLRREYGERGRAIVVREFSQSKVIAETMQVYNGLISQ